ncbi:hypothetical protein [Thiomicrorhabdus sediminis]|uniref:Uncharacterized protein n=1 Tax=Thiomicrorhabdus sediminis TaxID=2580412 RepID=A0A4P9K584_9GAMM|nr:hypothetical protein [Thiomicrorhabdus sediminis]QCU90155.1 hypothetical protein FE785_05695 [Thiomicrorhabdus sediminis]
MDIKSPSFNASSIAQNAFKQDEKALTAYSDHINASLKQQNAIAKGEYLPEARLNYQNYLEAEPVPGVEQNLLGIHMTEKHMLSLLKVIETEKQTFEQSMGKIFDGWA